MIVLESASFYNISMMKDSNAKIDNNTDNNTMINWSTDGWMDISSHSQNRKHLASPNFNQRPCDVSLLVIHCISLPPAEYGNSFIDDFFTNQLDSNEHPYFQTIADLKVSSHFLISRQGTITQYISVNDRAWHSGISCWQGQDNCNDYSIGIELEGTDNSKYTNQQYNSLQLLTISIQRRYPAITLDRIVGHSDIAPKRKTDPGSGFDWHRYQQSLK